MSSKVEFKTCDLFLKEDVSNEPTETVQEIFFDGDGVIPANILAHLLYTFEDKFVKASADVRWPDGSKPQVRFSLKVTRDDADNIVSNLNEAMDAAGLPVTNGQWWLADEE